MSTAFDPEALYVALDKRRRHIAADTGTRYGWRAVARELGISQSTFTRLGIHHKSLSAETLVLLMTWLGETDLKPYLSSVGGTATSSEEQA